MTRGRLLFVLCCFGVSAGTGGLSVSCVTDFWQNISCALNASDDPDVWFSSLQFEDIFNGPVVSCPLLAVGDGYHGDCKVKEDPEHFSALDTYTIRLCNETSCQIVEQTWYPFENIKLTPPPVLELQETPEMIKITCKGQPYQKHTYLSDSLDFELSLQDSISGEVTTFQLKSLNSFLEMDKRRQLKANTEYFIKARFKPDEKKNYKATWSEWSDSINWTNEAEGENIYIMLLKYLSPVCVLAVAFLIVFYSPTARMKIKTLSHTPTPATFFQPLFQKHEGNLQDWLSSQSKFAVTYNTENDLIADVVTVVPKPKNPEETQAFLGPSGPQLTFPLGQTSYVGVPVMHEVPLPVTVVCPGDPPYTQLPCSVWGFGLSDIQVIIPSAPVSELLETSRADSGCSCEDLTQSPESSLPSSPVEETPPPPQYCNDYCILNRTAGGVVPVLLSRESNGNVPADLLKSDG